MSAPVSRAEWTTLLVELAARYTPGGQPPDPRAELAGLGLGSVELVGLVGDIEEILGTDVSPSVVWEFPTIAALAGHFAGEAGSPPAADSAPASRPAVKDAGCDVAIVGIGCRLPGDVRGPAAFWQQLLDGIETVGEVPEDRWPVGMADPETGVPGRLPTTRAGYLTDLAGFDAGFFGIAPAEAQAIDPQQRLVAEVAWEATEDAGIPMSRLAGPGTGVWIGVSSVDYGHGQPLDQVDRFTPTGTAPSIIANRLSYLFDLRGPSIVVDTACSSSLVAILAAARAVAAGECRIALTGGTNVMTTPMGSIAFSQTGGLSPNGVCAPFSGDANGMVRGEGVVMFVLKDLASARRDGDRVCALIKGGAVNQDGRTNGLTAPNVAAQQAVLTAAQAAAGVPAIDIDYIEAHGTGTALGDPIEADALSRSVSQERARPLLIGSAKSNLGHTEATAGAVGVAKTALALYHGLIPATINARRPHPDIDLAALGLELVTETVAWPATGHPRAAGVSAFGFGGTNAHLILQQAPTQPGPRPARPAGTATLVTWSGRSAAGREAVAARLADHAEGLAASDLGDLAGMLAHHREQLDHRGAAVVTSPGQLVSELREPGADSSTGTVPAIPGRSAWVFSGQGARFWPLDAELASQPVIRDTLAEAAAVLPGTIDLAALLLDDDESSPLQAPELGQAAMVATQVALARLWQHWGLRPDVVLGHSVGEISAAVVAGAFSLADGIRIAHARGSVVRGTSGDTSMGVVGLPLDETRRRIAGREHLWIAAVNGPTTTVLAGSPTAVHDLVSELGDAGVFAREVAEPYFYPSHTPLMAEPVAQLARRLDWLTPAEPGVPMVSSVTGLPVTAADLGPAGWAANLSSPVRFDLALAAALTPDVSTVLEVSPRPLLLSAIREHAALAGDERLVAVSSSDKHHDGWPALLLAAGTLHCHGLPLDLSRIVPEPARRLDLPTRPWQHQRYWLPAPAAQAPGHPFLGTQGTSVAPPLAVWTASVSLADQPWLADHRSAGAAVLPGALWLEAFQAAADLAIGGPAQLRELELLNLVLTPDHTEAPNLHVRAEPTTGGWRLSGRTRGPDGSWQEAATATAEALTGTPVPRMEPAAGGQRVDIEQLYRRFENAGMAYGPAFRGLREARVHGSDVVAQLLDPQDLGLTERGFIIHPALLDACMQALSAGLADLGADAWVPVRVARLWLGGGRVADVRARLESRDDARAVAHLELFDRRDRLIGVLAGLELQRLAGPGADAATGAWRLDWAPADPGASGEPGRDPGDWLVVDAPRAQQLRDLLVASGARVGVVAAGEVGAAQQEASSKPTAVVVAGANLADVLTVVQHLAPGPRLFVATTGAHGGAGELDEALAGGAAWGLGAVVGTERSELGTTLVDLGPADELAVLADFLLAMPEGQRWRHHDGTWQRPRLVPADADEPWPLVPAGDSCVQLLAETPGILDSLVPVAVPRPKPGPGEVLVEVHGAPLNFSDVLKALNNCPGVEPGIHPLGLEFAGVVAESGAGVDLPVGAPVLGFAYGAMASHVVARADAVVQLPAGTDLVAAAGMPVAFATVLYGLEVCARIRPGDTVLVHSATGGIGQAAIQVARSHGANVIATAGSPEKRDALRAAGIEHVFDSRSLEFVDGVRAATGGRGVDIVVNSLSGRLMAESIGLLCNGGRFVELAKADIYADHSLALGALRGNKAYLAVDFERLSHDDPAQTRELLQRVADGLASGEFQPIPATTHRFEDAARAFTAMARAQHRGKLVLVPGQARMALRPGAVPVGNGTWVVTGAAGGLASVAVETLIGLGARSFALLVRRAAPEALDARVARWRAAGCQVEVLVADLGDRAQVATALAAARSRLGRITGVMHLAGVLDDALLPDQTPARFERVFGAKVTGARHLHELTADDPLEHFVAFSSAAGLLGSPGQANYAAANAALDALIEYRVARGRPGLSLQWGPWSGVGGATEVAAGGTSTAAAIVPTSPEQGGRRLATTLGLTGARLLATFDPQRIVDLRAAGMLPELLAPLAGDATPGAAASFVAQLASLPPGRARDALLRTRCREIAATVLKQDPALVGEDAPLASMGFDSLMSLGLRKRMEREFGVDLPATVVWQFPTIEVIAGHIGGLLFDAVADEPVEAPAPAREPEEVNLDAMSQADLEALLLAEINQ